ncbi:MAG: hypothetical protein LUE29_01995, partial [Lachnospiraceae bacterium]|nr:hypothetical protein [Lachnospiraceae bacterium]
EPTSESGNQRKVLCFARVETSLFSFPRESLAIIQQSKGFVNHFFYFFQNFFFKTFSAHLRMTVQQPPPIMSRNFVKYHVTMKFIDKVFARSRAATVNKPGIAAFVALTLLFVKRK